VVPAKLLCGFRAASAKIGFQTARGVVNPRVYDAAVMSGLSAKACFFLEHDQACARLHFQKLHGDRKAHDSATDNNSRKPLNSRIKPLLEMRLEALEHLSFNVMSVNRPQRVTSQF
jgi:hypothetical protein